MDQRVFKNRQQNVFSFKAGALPHALVAVAATVAACGSSEKKAPTKQKEAVSLKTQAQSVSGDCLLVVGACHSTAPIMPSARAFLDWASLCKTSWMKTLT